MFGNYPSRTTFVMQSPTDDTVIRVKLSKLLAHYGENPSAPEYQNTPAIQASAQAFVDSGITKGIVVLFDGMPILSAGVTEGIPSKEYN